MQELEGTLKERVAEVAALQDGAAKAEKRLRALEEEGAQLRKASEEATQVRFHRPGSCLCPLRMDFV